MGPVNPGAGAPPVLPANELESLRAEAQVMEEQLRAINERIAGFKGEARSPMLVAAVDREMCVACDVCTAVCPVGAIHVNDVAEVDPNKCTGCARCVTECPRGALSLHARS